MDLSDHSLGKATQDPAADAAAMLLRLGFAIFAIVIPSATLMSRWVIVVLVPIGAMLIILSTLLRGDPFRLLGDLARIGRTIGGLTALLLAVWAIFSLAWAPNSGPAAGKLFKALGVILLGLLAVLALPGRMRASNLHLVTIGVGLGAVLILAAGLLEAAGGSPLRLPAAAPGRSAVLLACMGWAAAAWMLIKNRRVIAVLLVGLVFAAALLGPTGEAIIPMGVGLIVFALAWAVPERAGRILALLAALLILAAPAIALIANLVANLFALDPADPLSRLALWWGLAVSDPVQLVTGRGFEAVAVARERGLIPLTAPASLVSDLWFDLGILGAAGFALLVYRAFERTGRLGYEVAPLALAGLACAFTFMLIDRSATQTWWLNGMAVFAIVLVSVERGRYRTVRPRASIKHDRVRASSHAKDA